MFFIKYRIKITQFLGTILLLLILFSHKNLEDIPAIADIIFICGITLVGVGTIGRIWCALFISGYKDRILIQSGPYSICRHPLYFFSLLGGLGIGLVTETFTIPVIILIGFILFYPLLMDHEEKSLSKIFGKEFQSYFQRTPKFFPKFSLFNMPEECNVGTKVFTRELIRSFFFIWMIGLLELIEVIQQSGTVPTLFSLY
jgi:protein-S-isoprenylcysteine O-methyltransferase Ste14